MSLGAFVVAFFSSLGSCKSVSSMFQAIFKGGSRKVHVCFKKVSSVFHQRLMFFRDIIECFKQFKGRFKGVSKVLQRTFMGVSRKCQGGFREDVRVF